MDAKHLLERCSFLVFFVHWLSVRATIPCQPFVNQITRSFSPLGQIQFLFYFIKYIYMFSYNYVLRCGKKEEKKSKRFCFITISDANVILHSCLYRVHAYVFLCAMPCCELWLPMNVQRFFLGRRSIVFWHQPPAPQKSRMHVMSSSMWLAWSV